MQNAQNTEIQQRVMNLVDLYRRKVGWESNVAKELADEYKFQYDQEIDNACALHEQGYNYYMLNIDIPKEEVDNIRANEQLLGYFYRKVAEANADERVLTHFLEDKYDSSIFTDEEEAFLMSHFAEMVNYIIQTPNNDLSAVEGDDRNDLYLLPQEVLKLIMERIVIPSGSKIYNPFTGFAQFANHYKDCSFICEESYMPYFKKWNSYCDRMLETEHIIEDKVDEGKLYAWMTVALYANGIDATVINDHSLPQEYDVFMSYIPIIPKNVPNNGYRTLDFEPSDTDIINRIKSGYQNLVDGGKMILIIPSKYLWERRVILSEGKTSFVLELEAFWKQLIEENSLTEIIQLPPVLGKSFFDGDCCIIIAEKRCKSENVTFIDARFASLKSENKLYNQTLDLDSLHAMVNNGGKEPNTGLRKLVQIHRTQCESDLLVPQVYVIEKPSEAEAPVPLTEVGSLVTSRVYDVKEDLPEDTPWVKMGDLSFDYKGELNVESLQKANCPNNPKDWKYGTMDISRLVMGSIGENKPSAEVAKISRYRNCKYIDGRKDAVLYYQSEDAVSFALIRATGRAIAVSKDIHVFYPKDGIDALSLLAILRQPIVYRQLQTLEKFGLYGPNGHLHNILVPTDKRIVYDEVCRMNMEKAIYDTQKEKFSTMKTDYINEVRMRKHDMGQYIFELVNIEDLLRYYIENRDKEKDYCHEIESLLDNFKTSLGELSTLLANLSKEEQFGDPEEFSLDNYLSQLVIRHKADGFKIVYERDVESIKRYNSEKHPENVFVNDILDEGDSLDVNDILDEGDSLDVNDILDEDDSLDVNDILDEDNSLDMNDILDEDNSLDMNDILDEDDSLDMNDILDEDDSLDMNDILDEDNSLDMNDILDEDNSLDMNDILDEDDSLDMNDILDEDDSLVMNDILDEGNSLSADDLIVLDNNVVKSISDSIPTINIAKNDVQRAVNNIIDNARKHGFRGIKNNNNEIRIKLAIDTKKNMFQIDFRNNGYPLPDGMNKMRYGLKGEKAGETGGTGIGGNYVKTFVEHYGGDYDVFMEDGWTVVRIYLPIK